MLKIERPCEAALPIAPGIPIILPAKLETKPLAVFNAPEEALPNSSVLEAANPNPLESEVRLLTAGPNAKAPTKPIMAGSKLTIIS